MIISANSRAEKLPLELREKIEGLQVLLLASVARFCKRISDSGH